MKLLQPITELEQVNPDWLTRTLHEKGHLPFGQVSEVRQEQIYSNNAFAASLRLSCSEETPQSAPGRLFVKIARHQRLIGGQGITLVHRDTHLLNILYPNQPQTDAARLVDWQSWWVDTGTNDLAYMMACHWYPEYRARLERPLLQRYWRHLQANGVVSYSWDDCWYDYRASVIRCLFLLLGSWHPKLPAAMWWERMEKAILAFRDLNCDELL